MAAISAAKFYDIIDKSQRLMYNKMEVIKC